MSAPLFEVTPETTVRLRIELPLTADEMAAALYYELHLVADDLVHDQDVRDALVLAVATEGLTAVRRRAERLRAEVAAGTVDAGWLAVCQRRLADVFAARPAAGRHFPASTRPAHAVLGVA